MIIIEVFTHLSGYIFKIEDVFGCPWLLTTHLVRDNRAFSLMIDLGDHKLTSTTSQWVFGNNGFAVFGAFLDSSA